MEAYGFVRKQFLSNIEKFNRGVPILRPGDAHPVLINYAL